MQALVTGGSGFIGSEVIRQLAARNIRARVLLRKTSPRYNLKGVDFDETIGDIVDYDSLKKAVEGVDYVFHLAGIITAKSDSDYLRFNGEGTGLLARAVQEVNPNLKRFVYVSSLAASGPSLSLTPRLEEDRPDPVSIYGKSKLLGEIELGKYFSKYPTTVVRPPAVYGPRDRGIFEFIQMVSKGITPVFPSRTPNKEKYISIIHVEDLVQGIVSSGLIEKQGKHETFFLTGDGYHTMNEIFAEMAKVLGKKQLRLPLPTPVLFGATSLMAAISFFTGKTPPLNADKINELKQDYWICSNRRAKDVLGFQPKWDMKSGIANAIAWYKAEGWI